MARRSHVTVRTHGLEWMEQRARDEGFTRAVRDSDGEFVIEPNVSKVIRLALAALRDLTEVGWRPEDWEDDD